MSDNFTKHIPTDLRHDDIGEEDVGHEGLQHADRLQVILGEANITSFRLKKMGKELNDDRIVFYDEYLVHGFSPLAGCLLIVKTSLQLMVCDKLRVQKSLTDPFASFSSKCIVEFPLGEEEVG
jgi:hypothetical protein